MTDNSKIFNLMHRYISRELAQRGSINTSVFDNTLDEAMTEIEEKTLLTQEIKLAHDYYHDRKPDAYLKLVKLNKQLNGMKTF